jgi:hypothetical protein
MAFMSRTNLDLVGVYPRSRWRSETADIALELMVDRALPSSNKRFIHPATVSGLAGTLLLFFSTQNAVKARW